MFKAYITNLGKYNEGELVGKWVEFPCEEEEFEQHLKEIGIGSTDEFGQPYEEWFVTDYEDSIGDAYDELGEYPSYERLQEFAEKEEKAEELDERYGNGFVNSLVKESGKSIDEIVEHKDDMRVIEASGGDDVDDIGYYYIDLYGGIENIGENTLEKYFDYESFGRDLKFDDYYDKDSGKYISAGERYCGDENASDYDVGVAYINEMGGLDTVDKTDNFDYEAYGRDLELEGDFTHVATDNYDYYWVEFV